MLILTISIISICLGSVSAENLEDINSTVMDIEENLQITDIDFESTNDEILAVSDESDDALQADGVSLSVVNQKSSYSKSDSVTVKMGTYSMASGSDQVSVYLNNKNIATTTYKIITTSGYTIPLSAAQSGSNSIYCSFTASGIWSLTSDTVTVTVTGGGSDIPVGDGSATISIYDMVYPSQSTITSNGDYVSDIAYTITKSGDGFSDESLELIINGQSIGSTTPNSYNRLGNLTFTEDNEWTLQIVYSALYNGKTVTATSNTLTFVTRNTSGGGNGSSTEDGSASIFIYDMAYPSQSTITSNGDYVSDIAYSITKSGDGFSDESLELIINGQSIGSTTPNSYNRLGNLTFDEDNTWTLKVIYTATVNGKTITAESNELTFITTGTSGGNGGDNPQPSGEMQIIIRDANYPNNSVISLNDKYNALIQYYVTVPSGYIATNEIIILCNGEAITTIQNPSDRTYTTIGGTFLLNETGDYVFTAQYKYVVWLSDVHGDIYSNSITYHVTISDDIDPVVKPALSINVDDVNYPNEVTAVVKSNIDGIYIVKIDGNQKEVTVSGGSGSVNFALPAKTYTATVESKTDSSIKNSTTFTVKSISKTTPAINSNVVVSNNKATITVNLPNDINNEKITVSLNGQNSKEAILNNGIATVDFDNLNDGDYSYTISYAGNDRYNDASITKTFTIEDENVNPVSQRLTIAVDDVEYPAQVKVIVKSDVDGDYIVTIGENSKVVKVSGGVGSETFTLAPNNYTANVMSKTDSSFKNATSFKVLKANIKDDEALNISIADDSNSPTFSIDLDGATGTFTVNVDGNDYQTKELENGKASITLDGLNEGNHSVVISYSGDNNYQSITKTTVLIVKNNIVIISNETNNNQNGSADYTGPTVEAGDLKRAVNSPYDFKATFYDKNGQLLKDSEVNFIVNGNDHIVKTDEFGVAKLVNCLVSGTYSIEIRNLATGETLTKKATIVDRITQNRDINVDYSYSANYKIRLYADNGQAVGANERVIITLNNVKYSVMTDKNGDVSFKVSGLLPGTYTITAEYKGVKVSNKVAVKQILKAKNAKFKKSKKVKKYKVTLKTSSGKAIKGKKITLKVKGKTYKAKTNKKGVATFKIKNLKKVGKFKATIRYLKTSIKKTITVRR